MDDKAMPVEGMTTAEMAGRPTTKTAPIFGQRLALLRKQRGWTQAELAKRLGSAVKMVTYYEREAENPTHIRLRAMVVSVDELSRKVNDLERGFKEHGPQFEMIFEAIHELMTPPLNPPRKKIRPHSK